MKDAMEALEIARGAVINCMIYTQNIEAALRLVKQSGHALGAVNVARENARKMVKELRGARHAMLPPATAVSIDGMLRRARELHNYLTGIAANQRMAAGLRLGLSTPPKPSTRVVYPPAEEKWYPEP